MQLFIPSVLSALEALLKGPIWLVRKIISIFFSRKEPPSLPTHSVALSSLSDSPYVGTAHSQHQRSPYEPTQWQQSPTHYQYPPPPPTAEHSESAYSQHQRSHERTQSQRPGSTLPRPQPRPPSQYTPPQPPSHRQPSVRLPARAPSPVSPDVSPVVEPLQSPIPQRSRRVSGPELPTRAPEDIVVPVVIDPDEDSQSLRLKARNAGDCMKECFKQSKEAFNSDDRGLAKRLSLRGEKYKDNMERLDKEASTKIYQENNQRYAGSNTIDLHGLFVLEAKRYFDEAVQKVRDSGISSLSVIVGKGNHSENNDAKIKRTIQEYGISLGLGVEVDPLNDGRLVVSLYDD
ncbi:hypothetical protein CY34DRAFT_292543 [Suillus luteus UH-Slu-Lm8-n1]|uniref:Unplaced genomic scaffold CY34scaffold_19, whole genome shotgun sequence n=1 Tax=Suillus luteus UH-Slu-Lm8-n1 TaxID=930992 RepID=A0A0D0BMS4_9AGAM|nr:hypothetical protein CY34DRAFT_292543 [Suillus luteus UH-Slu-Lm8-n1]